MTIFLSGSFSSAISLAARALFMLPDSCEEMVIAIAQSACSNCASHASGVGQAVSTNLITGTLEIYMCVSDKEADA